MAYKDLATNLKGSPTLRLGGESHKDQPARTLARNIILPGEERIGVTCGDCGSPAHAIVGSMVPDGLAIRSLKCLDCGKVTDLKDGVIPGKIEQPHKVKLSGG